MPFLVKYLQDIPQNCSECPCSIHITPKEVYCNALQKYMIVSNKRPSECEIIESKGKYYETTIPEKICKTCIFNYGKTFYYDYIICGYVNSKGTLYKSENETCDKWVGKEE